MPYKQKPYINVFDEIPALDRMLGVGSKKKIAVKYEARCFSTVCGSKKIGKLKDVPRFETFCPDCGYALFWKRLTSP